LFASALWALLLPPAATAAPAGNAAIWFTSSDTPMQKSHAGLLPRELVRQALLIAARDQLGLETRDESLREWRGDPPADHTILTEFLNDTITIRKPSESTPLWTKSVEEHWSRPLRQILQEMETDSRGPFVDALRQAGFDGHADAPSPDAPAPLQAEALLAQLDELSQFTALRLAHAAIRQDGESPQRLAVLVRAYANLGQLTRYHWAFDSAVFTARSLLYSQRMVAAEPKSAFALWHRAYACSLAGLNAAALDDLAAADALKTSPPPPWVALLDPLCRYQPGRLIDLATSDRARLGLGTFLAFLTVENSGSQGAIMGFADAALRANPNCLRLIDAMCDQTGPGPLQDLTESGPRIFGQLLGKNLERVPDMPQPIIDLIRRLRSGQANPAGRETVCQALIDAGAPDHDTGEPSWAALGREIQETTFAQVRRKAYLISTAWGIDASDYVASVQPLVADHPMKPLIDAYGFAHADNPNLMLQSLRSIPRERLTLAAIPLYRMEMIYQSYGPGTSLNTLNDIVGNVDITSRDLDCLLYLFTNQPRNAWTDDLVGMLTNVAPDSPLLLARAVRDHWDPDNAKKWEADSGGYPTVAFALGSQYLKLKQLSDAERCFKNYITVSPDELGYDSLASVYHQQRDDARWLATMLEYLQQPDYGLQHAQIQMKVADYYMDKRRYADALPYADDAAATGAGWALECQAAAHAGTGDWDGAEKIIEDEVQHYSSDPYGWFAWCVRTGHGNRFAASAALHDYLLNLGDRTDDAARIHAFVLDIAESRPDDALTVLQQRMDRLHGPVSGLHIAMLADAKNDAATRDTALAQSVESSKNNKPLGAYAALLRDTLRAGPKALPSEAAVDRLARDAGPYYAVTIFYCTACFLDHRGHTDAATACLKRCMGLVPQDGPAGRDFFDIILADAALRARGLDPLALERAARPVHDASLYP